MKYNIIHKWLLSAMMAVVSISFASCGGDDDDEIFNDPPVSLETTTVQNEQNWEYITPCLMWGCKRNEVKAIMQDTGWTLDTDSRYLEYSNGSQTASGSCEILYDFFGSASPEEQESLQYVRVTYVKYTKEYWKWLVSETEKQYMVALTLDESNDTMGGADGDTTINGQPVHISMLYSPGAVFISFSVIK